MIKRNEEMEIQHAFLVAGGNGNVDKQIILNPNEAQQRFKLFARITLPPGSSIGEHPHINDSEIYYITSGEVVVCDNGIDQVLHAGDVVFTSNGGKHSIANNTNSPAEFIAIIL